MSESRYHGFTEVTVTQFREFLKKHDTFMKPFMMSTPINYFYWEKSYKGDCSFGKGSIAMNEETVYDIPGCYYIRTDLLPQSPSGKG